ncbi:hypothetical protein MVEN_00092400 [Mycena venus]|uniref:Uncharacterized protein n=1 Tax=Mycena venus TaxID=2733690 RepID=A0A8H6Z7R2_9AGAR|nr:hypothetical protein MVEN_00092400 [Mycena venus]
MSQSSSTDRDPPPHPLLSVPNTSSTGENSWDVTQNFVSARSSASVTEPAGSEIGSHSSGEHTTHPSAPTGLKVRVCVDAEEIHYVVHPETGLRFDIEDDPAVPLETLYFAPPRVYLHPNAAGHRRTEFAPLPGRQSRSSPSSPSDLAFSGSAASGPTAESQLDSLLQGLGVTLNTDQRSQFSAIRGMLLTGRDTLLTTTAFVAEQRNALEGNLQAIDKVREEIADKLQELHTRVLSQEQRTEQCLEESLRALRTFGSTEAQLEQLTRSMAAHHTRTSTPIDNLRHELHQALPPQGPRESEEAFHQCGLNTVQRRGGAPTTSAVHFTQGTQFDDVGSISTGPSRPYQRFGGVPMTIHAPSALGTPFAFSVVPATAGAAHDSFH